MLVTTPMVSLLMPFVLHEGNTASWSSRRAASWKCRRSNGNTHFLTSSQVSFWSWKLAAEMHSQFQRFEESLGSFTVVLQVRCKELEFCCRQRLQRNRHMAQSQFGLQWTQPSPQAAWLHLQCRELAQACIPLSYHEECSIGRNFTRMHHHPHTRSPWWLHKMGKMAPMLTKCAPNHTCVDRTQGRVSVFFFFPSKSKTIQFCFILLFYFLGQSLPATLKGSDPKAFFSLRAYFTQSFMYRM